MLGLSVQIDGQRVPTQTRDDLQTLADFISSYLRITGTMEKMPGTAENILGKMEKSAGITSRAYPLRGAALASKQRKVAGAEVISPDITVQPDATALGSAPQAEIPQPQIPGIQSPGAPSSPQHRHKDLAKPASQRTSDWAVYAARSAQRPATASDLYHIAVADGFKSKAISPVNAFRTTVSALTKHGLLRLAGHNEEGILVYVVSGPEG